MRHTTSGTSKTVIEVYGFRRKLTV
jgi:hypothetical protein